MTVTQWLVKLLLLLFLFIAIVRLYALLPISRHIFFLERSSLSHVIVLICFRAEGLDRKKGNNENRHQKPTSFYSDF